MELITKHYSLQHDWYRTERRKFFILQYNLLFFQPSEKFYDKVKEVSENMDYESKKKNESS